MAFKNLLRGIQSKYDFIKYDFQFRGCKRLCKESMLTKPVNKIFFHKLESEGLMRVTIFLTPGRFKKPSVTVNRQLGETVMTLLLKICSKVRNLVKGGEMCGEIGDENYFDEVQFLLNGEPVDKSVYCSTIFDLDGELSFKILDDYYLCAVNEPYITLLRIDDTPVSGTFTFPLKLDALSTDKFDFKWFRGDLKDGIVNWTEVGKDSHYLIQDDDVSHHLKLECVPSNGSATGFPVAQITQNKVQSQFCSYYYHNTHTLTKEEVKEDMFRLVTYNVLANFYATTKEGARMFDYCPREAMGMNQRFSSIAIELFGYNSDLICIQEVDVGVYYKFWQPVFEKLGFTSKPCFKDTVPEGSMFLYRNRKFQLLCSENYNFGSEIINNPALQELCTCLKRNHTLYDKFISLRHVFQLTALQSKIKTDEVVVIGNIHLYSRPEGEQIRILQLASVFKLLIGMLRQLKPLLLNKNVSFILCGDFNTTPSSCIHDYVKNSKLDTIEMENVYFQSPTVFNHPLKMETAYETPVFTNYTRDFQDCLDYIYYETNRLEVDKVYPTASEEILSANIGIPSVAFPSDHLPLIADFKWKY